jgi:hypothetical protein
VRDLILVALGLKTPPWVQTRTITATVSVEDNGKIYTGTFTAPAQFTPKAPGVAMQPLPTKVRDVGSGPSTLFTLHSHIRFKTRCAVLTLL